MFPTPIGAFSAQTKLPASPKAASSKLSNSIHTSGGSDSVHFGLTKNQQRWVAAAGATGALALVSVPVINAINGDDASNTNASTSTESTQATGQSSPEASPQTTETATPSPEQSAAASPEQSTPATPSGGEVTSPPKTPKDPTAKFNFSEINSLSKLKQAGIKTTYWWVDKYGATNAKEGEAAIQDDQSISFENGAVSLTPRKLATPAIGYDSKGNPISFNYASSLLTTKDSLHIKPGSYTEVEFTGAVGNGILDAIWMGAVSEAWPPEIDFELPKPGIVHAGIHMPNPSFDSDSDRTDLPDLTKGRHKIAFDWNKEQNKITWILDGKKIYEVQGKDKVPQEAMYLAFTAAIPDMSTKTPEQKAWLGNIDTSTWKEGLRIYNIKSWSGGNPY